MWAEVRKLRRPLAEFLRNGARLERAEADAHFAALARNEFQKVDERGAVLEVRAVGRNFDARDHDLTVALLTQRFHLLCSFVHRQRAHAPARVRNEAVGAEVHAPVLDLEHRACAIHHTARGQHLKIAPLPDVVDIDNRRFVLCRALQKVDELRAVIRAGDDVEPELFDVLGMRLGVAAAGGDDRARVAALRLTEHLARLFVAHRRDRAGVDDVGVRRLFKIHQLVPAVQKLLFECLRFILVHLAPEGADRNFHVCLYPFPRFGR